MPAARGAAELAALYGIAPPAFLSCRREIAIAAETRNASPWKALVPDLVTMLTTPPGCSPYWAVSPVVWTLDSWSGIRKWNGQVDVAEGVVVIAAIQQEVHCRWPPAGNRNWPEPLDP